MRNRKKICAFLSSFFLLLSASVAVAAEPSYNNEEIFDAASGFTYKVVAYKGVASAEILDFETEESSVELTIPNKIAGYPVCLIGERAFADRMDITKVILPESVREIGKWAFSQSNVTEVVLPETLERIGDGAFYYCVGLEKINVPEHTQIGREVFRLCRQLRDENGFVIMNHVLVDGSGEWSETVTVPDGVTVIGASAFAGSMGGVATGKFILPSSVETIQSHAFFMCSADEILLSEGLKVIESNAFSSMRLSEITIPNSVLTIEKGAFQDIHTASGEKFLIKGKALSVAELCATEEGFDFEPTNRQLIGDVNGSDAYEAEDALMILQMTVKLHPVYGYTADMDLNGTVSADDALCVLQNVTKLAK